MVSVFWVVSAGKLSRNDHPLTAIDPMAGAVAWSRLALTAGTTSTSRQPSSASPPAPNPNAYRQTVCRPVK